MARTPADRLVDELDQCRADFDKLAWSVSHELRGPLNVVMGYLDLLAMQDEAGDPAETRHFIDAARDGATRLNALLDAMLDYSRVRADERDVQMVVLDDVVRGVLEAMSDPIIRAGATVRIGPLPTVPGNGRQLALALHHLVDNALAWRSAEPPRIELTAEATTDGWTLSITDNGKGIDPAHADRIFEMFQQHGSARATTTGAGLAIARRVFRRHGGDVRLAASGEEGSTFAATIASDGGDAGMAHAGQAVGTKQATNRHRRD